MLHLVYVFTRLFEIPFFQPKSVPLLLTIITSDILNKFSYQLLIDYYHFRNTF